MLQKISFIAMLGPLRIGAKENNLTSSNDPRRLLTIDQEAEIVRNLSFLCYRRKDPQAVNAICVEEIPAGKGLVVRLTVSGTATLYAEEGLRQICALLEHFSRSGKLIVIILVHAVLICCFDDKNARQFDVDVLFERVVQLNISRICARLQLRQKQDVKSSLVMQLYGVVNRLRTDISDEFREIQSQVRELAETYQLLKQHHKYPPEEQTYPQLEKMIKIARCVDQSPSLSTLLSHDSTLSPERVIIMKDWLAKLGHYYNACVRLVSSAMKKRSLFRNIRVESFEIELPTTVRSFSVAGAAIPLLKSFQDAPGMSKALQRYGNSQNKACNVLLDRLDGTRAGIKVHAEVKLLFYYATHPVKLKPRVICANKSACYLCDLFLRVHGQFQVPMTFGKLNERWILPDWLSIRPEELPTLRLAVERFNHILDEQILRLLKGVKRLPDPMESAIGLPAEWSPASSAQIKKNNGSTRSENLDGSNLSTDRCPRTYLDREESHRVPVSRQQY